MIKLHNLYTKQALNHRLVLEKVHRVIKFNQNVWLKPDIDMKTDLRKKAKNDLEIFFFQLMNNAVFERNYGKYGKTQVLLHLPLQKEEETIWFQNQVIILQLFSQKIYQQQE